jgi:hypothetical protein
MSQSKYRYHQQEGNQENAALGITTGASENPVMMLADLSSPYCTAMVLFHVNPTPLHCSIFLPGHTRTQYGVSYWTVTGLLLRPQRDGRV